MHVYTHIVIGKGCLHTKATTLLKRLADQASTESTLQSGSDRSCFGRLGVMAILLAHTDNSLVKLNEMAPPHD